MIEQNDRPYLNLNQAAEKLNVSIDEIQRLLRTGELPFMRLGRSVRIPFYAVEALVNPSRPAPVRTATLNAPNGGAPQAATPPAKTPSPIDPSRGPAPSNGTAPKVEQARLTRPVSQLIGTPDQSTASPGATRVGRLPPKVEATVKAQPTAGPSEAPPKADPPGPPAAATIVRPVAAPWAQNPVVIRTGPNAQRRPGRIARILKSIGEARLPKISVPLRTREVAVLSVSDAKLRAIVTRNGRVMHWATAGLKDGVIRDGAVVDPEAFSSALAALEARLAGPRLIGRPLAVVVSGRNLVFGRLEIEPAEGEQTREAMRRLVCEKLSVRSEEVAADFYPFDGRPKKRRKKNEKAAEPGSRAVFGIAVLRGILDSVLRPIAAAGSRVVDLQPKAIALAAAAGGPLGIIVDLEPTSLTVIVVRDGLVEVVRDVAISPDLRPPQIADILAGQVNRSVGYYNARYPDTPLPQDTPIIVTGDGAVEPLVTDLALAALPYPRRSIPDFFDAPDGFRSGQYAAALGAAQQLTRRHRSGKRAATAGPSFYFVPEEYRPRPLPMKTLIAGAAALVMFIGLVPAYQAVASVSGKADRLRATVDRLEPQVRVRTIQVRRATLVREKLDVANAEVAKLLVVEEAIKGRDRAFADTLAVVRGAVPAGVALQEVDDDGTLVLVTATAAVAEDLFTFVRALSAVGSFSEVRIRTLALNGTSVTASIAVFRGADGEVARPAPVTPPQR